jgi:hypothetical protein
MVEPKYPWRESATVGTPQRLASDRTYNLLIQCSSATATRTLPLPVFASRVSDGPGAQRGFNHTAAHTTLYKLPPKLPRKCPVRTHPLAQRNQLAYLRYGVVRLCSLHRKVT